MIFGNNNKRLKAEIEVYRQRLASDSTVKVDETISCHSAILIISNDIEQRVRSIQTLHQLGSLTAVPAAVNELIELSQMWPKKDVNGWPHLLLSILREVRVE